MAFSEQQAMELSAKLSAKHVKTREVSGQRLTYIEGWHAIAEANRIFGYDAWDRNTVSAKCVWSGMHRGAYVCTYTAKVRVTVRAGETRISREGCGTGEGKGLTPGDAHDIALKSAETDATKRALATFGNPFGLALYDKELKGVWNAAKLRAADTETRRKTRFVFRAGKDEEAQFYEDPKAFCDVLGCAIDSAPTIEALFELWEQNLEAVRALEKTESNGAAARTAPVDKLSLHFQNRAILLAQKKGHETASNAASPDNDIADTTEGTTSSGIDKSALVLGEAKRRRSKDHLKYVARQPCLLCGRSPSQAHHLRFAQPRAMGRKVSDEFTVPLCASHHDDVHRAGDERSWWKDKGIDALPVVRKLWMETVGRGRDDGADRQGPSPVTLPR